MDIFILYIYIMNQYQYGIKQEKRIIEILKSNVEFNNIEPTIERYDDWDFFDYENKIKIELKSRTIKFNNNYKSTIIGSNKIYKGKILFKKGFDIYYFFNYIDKILYYKLDIDDNFNQAFFNGKNHTFIPNNKLKEFI